MNQNIPSEKRRFAAAYLCCFDAALAARSVGRTDGVRLLSTPGVQAELSLQRQQCDICQQDVIRRLAQLAFGRANDCVKLVLQDNADFDALDLSLLSEVRRNDKGTVEIKLLDRVRALEQLLGAVGQANDAAAEFFAAAEEVED